MNHDEKRLYLIKYLLDENKKYNNVAIPDDVIEQKKLLRSLFNVRMPSVISDEFLMVQDEYLQEETKFKKITDVKNLEQMKDGMYL